MGSGCSDGKDPKQIPLVKPTAKWPKLNTVSKRDMEMIISQPSSATENESFLYSEGGSSSFITQTDQQSQSDSSNPRKDLITTLENGSSSCDSWMKGWQRYEVEPVKLRSTRSPRRLWQLKITDMTSTRNIFKQLKTAE